MARALGDSTTKLVKGFTAKLAKARDQYR